MPCLSASELLNLWERTYSLSPARRAVEIVRAGLHLESWEEVANWPIGFRDRQIARIRAEHFGHLVPSVSNCPNCQAQVEFEVHLDQCFRLRDGTFAAQSLNLLLPGIEDVRPLTTADVIRHLESLEEETALLNQCVSVAPRLSLSTIEMQQVAVHLEQLDPEAKIEFGLLCPDCSNEWSSLFDIAAVFWIELNTWARRTMQEIHQLASRYGWTEEEILRITPWRRAIYLNMTGAR